MLHEAKLLCINCGPGIAKIGRSKCSYSMIAAMLYCLNSHACIPHHAERLVNPKVQKNHKIWPKLAKIDQFSNFFGNFSQFSGRGTHHRQF
jgi:hypothetical protein